MAHRNIGCLFSVADLSLSGCYIKIRTQIGGEDSEFWYGRL